MRNSTSRPVTAAAAVPSSSAIAKLPVRAPTSAATNAPTMNSDPWARLITFMMPKVSVRPEETISNVKPSWRPLRVCSRKRPIWGGVEGPYSGHSLA